MLCLTHKEALCDIVPTSVQGVRRKALGTCLVTVHVKLYLYTLFTGGSSCLKVNGEITRFSCETIVCV